MTYVAPATKSANTKLASAEYNVLVNDIIDLNTRSNQTIGLFSARPASATIGSLYYQTDTDELVKYVTDLDAQNRWMQASPEYRRNFVINGGFDFWQRGTSFNPVSATTTTGLNYGADRWQFLQATTSAAAFTRQAITSTDPAGYNYYTRVQRVAAATLVTPYTIQTSFESVNIQNIRGKYVTLSFWARAGANYSAASGFLVSDIVTGTGTDNTVGNFTTNTVNTTANNVLTTSWKRFSITTSAVLAATITQLGVRFVFTPVGTAGAADQFDITGVQLEIGTAPSDFEFRDFGEELRRCQRYYYRIQCPSTSAAACFGTGLTTSTTASSVSVFFPVTMRIAPTALEQSGTPGNYAVYIANTVPVTTSGPSLAAGTSTVYQSVVNYGYSATGSPGQAMFAGGSTASGTSAYLGWSAEL